MRVLLPKVRRPDHSLAEVALAAVLPAEGLVPVVSGPAEVACVFEPNASGPPPVRVAIVDALEPGPRWREAGERFAAVDERARDALVALGVPGERVTVTGWPLAPRWRETEAQDREALRQRFGLGGGAPVVLVDTRELGELLGPLIVQLSLAQAIEPLFDAPDETTAALLRARCPAVGIRARRFGEGPEVPLLWRAADLVVGRPRPQLVAQARAMGLGVVAVSDPARPEELTEAEGVEARGLGRAAALVTVAATLDLLAGERLAAVRREAAAGARPEAAQKVAALVAETARHREAILAEPRPMPPAPAAGLLEEVGVSPEEHRERESERLAARILQRAQEKEVEERLAALKARMNLKKE